MTQHTPEFLERQFEPPGPVEHTPGPWKAEGPNIWAGEECVAVTTAPTKEADARLIAKAPEQEAIIAELLEALRATVETLDAYGIRCFRTKDVTAQGHTAIAKATE